MTFSITGSTHCEKETLSYYKEQIIILDLAFFEEAAKKLVWLFEDDVSEHELFFYALSCIKDQSKVLERIKALTTEFDFDYGLNPESAVWLDSYTREAAQSFFQQATMELMITLQRLNCYSGDLLMYDYIGRTPAGNCGVFAQRTCPPNSPVKTTSTLLSILPLSSRLLTLTRK